MAFWDAKGSPERRALAKAGVRSRLRLARHAAPMIELEIYAPGLRETDKIMELNHALAAVAGLRFKVDSHHDIVYLEFDEPPAMTSAEVRNVFVRMGLESRFVGAVSPELRPKAKTQRIRII